MKQFIIAITLLLLVALPGCKAVSDEAALVGLWVNVDMPVNQIELRDDGTGTDRWTDTGDEFDYKWSVNDGQLCTIDSRDQEECTHYSVEGDRMTITVGDTPWRYERWP